MKDSSGRVNHSFVKPVEPPVNFLFSNKESDRVSTALRSKVCDLTTAKKQMIRLSLAEVPIFAVLECADFKC